MSDNKVTFGGNFSAEEALVKNEPFFGGWIALYAGNDVTHVTPVLQVAKHLVLEELARGVPETPALVARCVDSAYTKRLHDEINASVLRPFGFDVATFQAEGKSRCTESVYSELCFKLSQASLSGLTFLLCGFDSTGHAHLLLVDGVSAPKSFDNLGFWAIGSGGHAALSSLAFGVDSRHILPPHVSVEKAMYAACAAKFMSESASDVGRSTFAVVFGPQAKDNLFLGDLSIDRLRQVWRKECAPRITDSAVSLVKEGLVTVDVGELTPRAEVSPQASEQSK